MKPMTHKEIRLLNEKVQGTDKGLLSEANSKWAEQVRVELANELGMDLDDVEITSDDGKKCSLEGSGASNGESEWDVYKNEKDAYADAVERATDSLQDGAPLSDIINMGGNGHEGWIKKFIYVTNTDVRLISNEEADRYIEDIKEEDDGERICDEAGMSSKYEKIKEKMDETEDEKELSKLEKELEKLVDKAGEKVHDNYSKDLKKRLEKDPIEYAEELGYDDLGDVSWLNVDWDKAGKYAVDTDGIAHTLDGYDGEELELKSGTAYGTN